MSLAKRSIFTLEIPEQLNPDTLLELQNCWEKIDFEQVRFILVRGQKKAFCLGMDINWVANQLTVDFKGGMDKFISFLKRLQSAPAVTIAVVEGDAIGGGVGIVAACDFVLASTMSTFRLTEGMMNLVPGIILCPLLSRLSPQTIKQMVFTAREHNARGALDLGLADKICKPEQVEDNIQKLIDELRNCKNQSVRDLKSLLTEGLSAGNDALYQLGASLLEERLADPRTREKLLSYSLYSINKEDNHDY